MMARRFLAQLLIGAVALMPVAARAQTEMVAPPAPDADALAAEMRALAANPNDLAALLNAGDLALKLGDPTAAAGFFARAEKIDPRSGRQRAGTGSILLQLERPGEALRRFGDAEAYGYDPARYAADRGMAFDLVGDQARAQRDYRLALTRDRNDGEVLRRYALSLAISGERDLALEQIDRLVRQSDRAAWRVRAFVLAMTGDVAGAEKIAGTMLPGGMAQNLTPFFQRLARLSPVDRAWAVHFGQLVASPERLADSRLAPSLPPLPPEIRPKPPVQLAAATPVQRPERRDRKPRPTRDKPVAIAAATPPPVVKVVSLPPPPPVAASAPVQEAKPKAEAPPKPDTKPTQLATATLPIMPRPAPPEQPKIVTKAEVSTAQPGFTAIDPVPVASPTPPPIAATPERDPAPAIVTEKPIETAPPASPPPVATPPVSSPPVPAPAPPPVEATIVPAPQAQASPPPAPKAAAAEPVAEATKPMAPPTREAQPVGREDSILARIIANIGVPAAELDVPPVRPRAKPPTPAAELPPIRSEPDAKPAAPTPTATPAAAKPSAEAKKVELAKVDTKKPDPPIDPKVEARRKAEEKKKAEAKAKADAEKAEAKKQAALAKAAPSRIWVQVAGGASEGDLPKAWAAVRAKAPAAFRGKQGWSTPLRFTNRVLAGPFKSSAEAQAFVNDLTKAGISSFVFTSAAGQVIDKLGAP